MMEFRAAKHLKIKRELQKEKSHNRQKKKKKKQIYIHTVLQFLADPELCMHRGGTKNNGK